jgi:hypothetical protein
MLAALLRYPRRQRKAVARRWAHRSNAVQAAARLARGLDFKTVHRRALDDARGDVVREGVTYHGTGRVTAWQIRRSVRGRVDQLDIVVDGVVWRTGGPRRVRAWLAA